LNTTDVHDGDALWSGLIRAHGTAPVYQFAEIHPDEFVKAFLCGWWGRSPRHAVVGDTLVAVRRCAHRVELPNPHAARRRCQSESVSGSCDGGQITTTVSLAAPVMDLSGHSVVKSVELPWH
jgi:hypothetical protein